MQTRRGNWVFLNKKLAIFRCELDDLTIDRLIGRNSTADAVNLLRTLAARLPSYEPIYLSKQAERASMWRSGSIVVHQGSSTTAREQPTVNAGVNRRISTAKAASNESSASSKEHHRRPSMARTNKIMET